MTKFKVGDVVTPSPHEDGFLHDYLVRSGKYTVVACGEDFVDVEGVFNGGDGVGWDVSWFELAEEQDTNLTAESLKNTIFSIRQEREQTLSKLKDLDTQEAEAISQLNALGFSLFEEGKVNNSPSKTVLYVEDIEEDMTNYDNWENGDILEVITHTNDMIPFGALVKHADVDGCESPYTSSEYHDCWAISDCYLKFHSRPVK